MIWTGCTTQRTYCLGSQQYRRVCCSYYGGVWQGYNAMCYTEETGRLC
jgi:hypothetical protein